MTSVPSNLRVLHLVRSLRVGGLEKVVVDLTHGLAKKGVVSHLGCLLDAGEWADRAKVQGTWIGNLEEKNPLSVFLSLWRYIRKNEIDLIHTHNSHPHKYGVPLSILTGIPLVHTKHGRNWPNNPRWVWFSRQLSRFTKVIVAVSRDIEKIVTDIEKVPACKVVTILNGVETRCSDPPPLRYGVASKTILGQDYSFRENLGISPDAFIIGSVGRFSPEKQYPWLVKVFDCFHRKLPNSLLVLVGDGPDRENIEAVIEEVGLSKDVLLSGIQSNVADWLACMDVFCLSSDQEGTSLTLIEAGLSGLPSVVTDVGGNPEIVADRETGYVVPSGDGSAMVAALLKLADAPDTRRALGASARARMLARYSLDGMVDKYLDVYLSSMSIEH